MAAIAAEVDILLEVLLSDSSFVSSIVTEVLTSCRQGRHGPTELRNVIDSVLERCFEELQIRALIGDYKKKKKKLQLPQYSSTEPVQVKSLGNKRRSNSKVDSKKFEQDHGYAVSCLKIDVDDVAESLEALSSKETVDWNIEPRRNNSDDDERFGHGVHGNGTLSLGETQVLPRGFELTLPNAESEDDDVEIVRDIHLAESDDVALQQSVTGSSLSPAFASSVISYPSPIHKSTSPELPLATKYANRSPVLSDEDGLPEGVMQQEMEDHERDRERQRETVENSNQLSVAGVSKMGEMQGRQADNTSAGESERLDDEFDESRHVHFTPTVISNVFITREKYTRDEVSELFFSHDDADRFAADYENEVNAAETAGLEWGEWMDKRTEEDHTEQRLLFPTKRGAGRYSGGIEGTDDDGYDFNAFEADGDKNQNMGASVEELEEDVLPDRLEDDALSARSESDDKGVSFESFSISADNSSRNDDEIEF